MPGSFPDQFGNHIPVLPEPALAVHPGGGPVSVQDAARLRGPEPGVRDADRRSVRHRPAMPPGYIP